MVTVSLCKGKKKKKNRSVCVGVCFSNSCEPHSSTRLSLGSAAQTQLSNPVKQKIIRLCSFVNLGWTCKLHICWFIIVDVPVAGAHRVEDHINGLTHLFFTLAKGWGFRKHFLKRTPGTRDRTWRLDWNFGGFGNKRASRLWSRCRCSYPRHFIIKLIFLSRRYWWEVKLDI